MAYLKKVKGESAEAETPKKMLAKVSAAVNWRDKAKYDETWSTLIKMYGSLYEYPELTGYTDVIAPNMVFSTVNVIVPSIAINYPKITVTARKQESESRASIVEAAANYYWRHFDVHDEFRAMIKDFSIVGHGWLKTTWAFSEEKRELAPDEWKQEVAQALTQRNLAEMEGKKRGIQGVTFPTDKEIVDSIPTTTLEVVEDHPMVERISPFDVFIDPAVTRLKDARWIAQRMYVPIEVARRNEAWDAAARKQIHAAVLKRDKVDVLREGEDVFGEAEFAIVWEFYDLVEEKLCVFAEDCDKWLIAPVENEMPFEHPFVFVENYSVPEKLYPIGDVETIMPLQRELATTRTQMINDRKRFRRMYMYRPDDLGEDGVNALLSGDDNAMIEVEGDRPFTDIIAPMGTQQLPPEFYNQSTMILDDINLVSGISEYQRGAVAEIRRTATEASMIQDASNARSADKLSIIERAIGEVARRVVQMAQKNLTTTQVAKITSDNGQVDWIPFDAEDIEGEFDFEVEAGSTQPQNETFRRQSALQLMDTMAPFIQMGVVDPRKLAEHVLKNGFGVKNPEQFLAQQQPMAPQQPGMPAGVPPQGGMPPQGQPPTPMDPNAMMGGQPPMDAGGMPQLPPELLAMLAQAQGAGGQMMPAPMG